MEKTIVDFISAYGYIAIFLLIFIENLFPPIPSEVILIFGGFMTSVTQKSTALVIIISTVASTIGAIVLYLIGRLINKSRIEQWLNGRIGKVLKFKKQDIEKANNWFERKGNFTVFFCRFIPVVRSLISIPAGMAKMNIVPFIVLTLIGSAIWNSVLIFLGKFAGNSWGKVAKFFDKFSTIVIMLLMIMIIILLFKFVITNIKKGQQI